MQESKERQALWVVPHSLADIEDEVVRTVQSSVMTDRGVDIKRDLQVLASCIFLPLQTLRVYLPRTMFGSWWPKAPSGSRPCCILLGVC